MIEKYQIVYADCPWPYADQSCQGTMANHYRSMKISDLCGLPVESICDDNCVMFFWATYPMMKEALCVIESWGFTYKSIAFQWVKLNKNGKGYFYGLGRWTRGNTEPCLIATKGKPKRISAGVFQIIEEPLVLEAPITRHSEKPIVVRDKIVELMGDLPRIELFARKGPKVEPLPEKRGFKYGWVNVGNEIDGMDIRDSLNEIIKGDYL